MTQLTPKTQGETSKQGLTALLHGTVLSTNDVMMKMAHCMATQGHRLMRMPQVDPRQIPNNYLDVDEQTHDFTSLHPEQVEINRPEGTALLAKGVQQIAWGNLRGMPSMMVDYINALGATIFMNFGLKKGGEILFLSAFDDAPMTHEPLELNAVIHFLEGHYPSATRETMILAFDEAVIANYAPECRVYYAPDRVYLVINEPQGQGIGARYIYSFERAEQLSEHGGSPQSLVKR